MKNQSVAILQIEMVHHVVSKGIKTNKMSASMHHCIHT